MTVVDGLSGLPADALCVLGGSFMPARDLLCLSCCARHYRDTFRANTMQVWRLQLAQEFARNAPRLPAVVMRLGSDECALTLYQRLTGVREVGRVRGGSFCYWRSRVVGYDHASSLFGGSPACLVTVPDDPAEDGPRWCPLSRLRRENPWTHSKLRDVGEPVEVLQERTPHFERCVRHGSIRELDWIGKMHFVDFEPQSYEPHHVIVLRCLVEYHSPPVLADTSGWDCEATPAARPAPSAEWVPLASPRLRDALAPDEWLP